MRGKAELVAYDSPGKRFFLVVLKIAARTGLRPLCFKNFTPVTMPLRLVMASPLSARSNSKRRTSAKAMSRQEAA